MESATLFCPYTCTAAWSYILKYMHWDGMAITKSIVLSNKHTQRNITAVPATQDVKKIFNWSSLVQRRKSFLMHAICSFTFFFFFWTPYLQLRFHILLWYTIYILSLYVNLLATFTNFIRSRQSMEVFLSLHGPSTYMLYTLICVQKMVG